MNEIQRIVLYCLGYRRLKKPYKFQNKQRATNCSYISGLLENNLLPNDVVSSNKKYKNTYQMQNKSQNNEMIIPLKLILFLG